LSHFSQNHQAHAHQNWKIIPVLKENHLSLPYHAYYHRHVKLFISLKPDQSTSRFCSRRLRKLHSCDRKKFIFFTHKKKRFLELRKIFLYMWQKFSGHWLVAYFFWWISYSCGIFVTLKLRIFSCRSIFSCFDEKYSNEADWSEIN
jgi:hypothetical protein